MSKYIVGLDIGSKNICATLAIENENNEFEVIDFISKECLGVSKGYVEDSSLVVNSIRECLGDLESLTGYNIKKIYMGIGCDKCRIISTRGYKYIGAIEAITESDIESAYLDGKNISVEPDEYIIDGVIKSFYTVEHGFTENPLGFIAEKLEVDLDIVVGKKHIVKDLKNVVLEAGYEISGMLLGIDSLKNVFLSENTALNNVAIVNVGSDKTEISLYKSNQLKAIGFVPLGGNNITKDLSICLGIEEKIAEKLKKECASDYISIADDSVIDIGGKEVECKLIYEIIDARIDEIIQLIHNEFLSSEFYDDIDLVIITGDGISYFEDIKNKVAEKINKNIKTFTKNSFYFNNSSIITSIGIVKEVYDRLKLIGNENLFCDTNVIVDEIEQIDNNVVKKKAFSKIKAFLNEIF